MRRLHVFQRARAAADRESGFAAHGLGDFGGLRLVHQLFPVAAFLDAGADLADLRILLDDELRAALGARLGDRHVGRGEVAIGIPRAAVENARAAAATSAAAADKFPFVA